MEKQSEPGWVSSCFAEWLIDKKNATTTTTTSNIFFSLELTSPPPPPPFFRGVANNGPRRITRTHAHTRTGDGASKERKQPNLLVTNTRLAVPQKREKKTQQTKKKAKTRKGRHASGNMILHPIQLMIKKLKEKNILPKDIRVTTNFLFQKNNNNYYPTFSVRAHAPLQINILCSHPLL